MIRTEPQPPALLIGFTGKRHVGKSTATDILEEWGFARLHTFGPGLSMAEDYFKRCGASRDQANRMARSDLKDVPSPLLPGNAKPRYFLEKFGFFMGNVMGPEWTMGVELAHKKRTRANKRDFAVESVVYEADYFRSLGGIIIRLHREQANQPGLHTDAAQAEIQADYDVQNNSDNKQDLRVKLQGVIQTIYEKKTNEEQAGC